MQVHGIQGGQLPTHKGYHYCSTAVEWFRLLDAIHEFRDTELWNPMVTLQDGIRAVEIGLHATDKIDS